MIFRLAVIAALLAVSGPALAQAPAAGADQAAAENYKQTCLPCHMVDGNAALEPMNLADGVWRQGSSVKEVARTIAEGVPGTAMMPFKTRFNEQEILALAKYVRAFDKSLKAGPSAKKKATK
jgi:mono/diheme cytochrome c family protein